MRVRRGEVALGRGGLRVGPLAFGGAPIGNLGQPVSEVGARGALTAAWESGLRYFDTAPHYGLGLSERRFGAGLAGRPRLPATVAPKHFHVALHMTRAPVRHAAQKWMKSA